jgi:hypothetical protein
MDDKLRDEIRAALTSCPNHRRRLAISGYLIHRLAFKPSVFRNSRITGAILVTLRAPGHGRASLQAGQCRPRRPDDRFRTERGLVRRVDL